MATVTPTTHQAAPAGHPKRLGSALVAVVWIVVFTSKVAPAGAWEFRGMAYFLAFRDYDHQRVNDDLREIREIGCNWVSLDLALTMDTATASDVYLPYAREDQSHATAPYRHEPELWHHFPSDDEIRHFVDTAHKHGLSVMLKPHVHPKHSGLRLRTKDGSLVDPMLPACVHPHDVDAWFRSYRRILLHYADTLDVDAVCVGDELSGLYGYDDHWRILVAELRAVTDAKITCAFNWHVALHHEHRLLLRAIRLLRLEDNLLRHLLQQQGRDVVFADGAERRIARDTFAEYPTWCDALDLVGVNFYFPLSARRDPSLGVLREAWRSYPISTPLGSLKARYVESLVDWAESIGRPLLFTEGGWGKWNHAAQFPADWYASAHGANPQLQARCYEAFFLEVAPAAVGMFFWDWVEKGYSPQGGPAEDIVRRHFAAEK